MVTVILCAAGKSERTGFYGNKILRELNGLPVLCYSLSAFSSFADEILVACRKEDEGQILPLLTSYPAARTVPGGDTRAQTVYFALNEAKGDIVLVHDAARPFVTQKIILDCIESVKEYGSGVCSLPSVDTTVIAENGCIRQVPARKNVFTVQTPQGFLRKELLFAYERAFEDERECEFTDDSGVYAAYVAPPRLFFGDRSNKKLTYREDFYPAERVGFGVDTHAFAPKVAEKTFDHVQKNSDMDGVRCNKAEITLGGVKIPSDRPLIAHSDGDVLVHALMDALLSAAGLRDIGYYFPDSDETYRGADSMRLLRQVLSLLGERRLAPKNVGISILAETPRLSPYIREMQQNLASALDIEPSAVGIAAGTNEKLGYIGEGKGITVYATVLLRSDG